MAKKSRTYERFIEKVKEISYLNQALSMLRWDQETYMPPGTVNDRAKQVALLSGIVHERMTSKAMGRMLAELKKDRSLDEDQAVNVREFARDFKRATALPAALVKELSETESYSLDAWGKARKEMNYKKFEPWLDKTINLKCKVAEHIGYKDQPYDALLEEYEPMMPTKDVEAILTPFRKKLVPLVAKISKAAKEARVDESFLTGDFNVEAQRIFFTEIVKDMGYDFERGRLDVTTHPFTIGEALDVRITTRYNEKDLRPGLFSCIHEAGHGLYEQGTLAKNYHTPMGVAQSLGIHESQSRLWENVVGRGMPFWKYYLPRMQKAFPALCRVPLDLWHKAINMVRPSFIRVEADEVTYNLHILLRFELEREILEGKVKISEVPAVWNERMEKYLGIVPPDDVQGCLQDVHWAFGLVGYFPTYTLGNLLAAQLYDKVQTEMPGVEYGFAKGKFAPLLGWLRQKIHQHGRRYMYLDLCRKVTGSTIDEDHFINYLKKKYGPLFGVQL